MELNMKILNKLDDYLTEKNYKIIIKKDNINIINYQEIKDFSNNQVTITTNENQINITGDNLVVSKMQDSEVLITGKIQKLEL